jgi:hypothetical protein
VADLNSAVLELVDGPADNTELVAAIDAEQVESNPLYVKNHLGLNETWCNLFAANVSKRKKKPIPPVVVNAQLEWLRAGNGNYRRCSQTEAELASATGGLGVRVRPDQPHGHIQILRGDGRCAQAGSVNFSDGPASRGFSAAQLAECEYYAVQRSS